MDKLIIHIIRSTKAFPSTNFFLNTLEWNLRKNENAVDYVKVYNGEKNEDGDVKAKLLIITNDKDVKAWAMMNNVDYTDPTPKLEKQTNILMNYWNGVAYKSLPKEFQASEDKLIAQKIAEYAKTEKVEIINRYPSVKFRAKQKLNSIKKKGMIPTKEMFVEEYRKNTELAEEIREKVTWRDDQPAIDPDTDLPYSKEENDANQELLNSYTFNANLAMACAQEFIQ